MSASNKAFRVRYLKDHRYDPNGSKTYNIILEILNYSRSTPLGPDELEADKNLTRDRLLEQIYVVRSVIVELPDREASHKTTELAEAAKIWLNGYEKWRNGGKSFNLSNDPINTLQKQLVMDTENLVAYQGSKPKVGFA